MTHDAAPDWPHSVWIGAVDISEQPVDGLELASSAGYERARLLVREGHTPLGFIEVSIRAGRVEPEELSRAVTALPRVAASEPPAHELSGISVVLCTRDRADELRTAVESLLELDYPAFELVIVDNASATDAASRVVGEIDDSRVHLVKEPRPGLARARNRGVLEAAHPIVAFTDDDVVVDPYWLRGLSDGFRLAEDVACVCGMVPSGEIQSFSQAYFDARVTWASSCVSHVFRLATPPAGEPLFPFRVGQYGTGANFAMRRSVTIALGGFDEALGVGSPTRGGEDIDMFVRVLLAGHALAYLPSAVVWHRHRADMSALHDQIVGYGLGLGAWIAKLLSDRRTAPMVLRRGARGLLHMRRATKVSIGAEGESGGFGARKLAATERWAAAQGPLALFRARRAGARSQPLRSGASDEPPFQRI
jgi:GT2 family glycosyltransferase